MRWSWRLLQFVAMWVSTLLFKIRRYGVQNVPSEGPALLVANHQCYGDPIIVSIWPPREIHFMAMAPLFENPRLAPIIRHLNAFPVKPNFADVGAIKHSLRLLRDGQLLLIFPEGTRTYTGELEPFLAGVGVIAKRAKVPIVPVLLEGLYEAWPMFQRWPGPSEVIVEYGVPLPPEEYADWNPDQLMTELHHRITAMQSRRRPFLTNYQLHVTPKQIHAMRPKPTNNHDDQP